MLDYTDPAMLTVVLDTVERIARQRRVIWLKIDPDARLGEGVPGTESARPDATGEQVISILKKTRVGIFRQSGAISKYPANRPHAERRSTPEKHEPKHAL